MYVRLFQGEWIRTVFAALLMILFCINCSENTGLTKKLTDLKPVKLISDMSYDMYLIHFFIIGYFSFAGRELCFVIVFILSFLTAIVLKKWYNAISGFKGTKSVEKS